MKPFTLKSTLIRISISILIALVTKDLVLGWIELQDNPMALMIYCGIIHIGVTALYQHVGKRIERAKAQ